MREIINICLGEMSNQKYVFRGSEKLSIYV